MPQLKEKIRKTKLFNAEEKIELLSCLEKFSLDELQKLESAVDKFDQEYQTITQKFKNDMTRELYDLAETYENPQEKEEFKKGVETLIEKMNIIY